MSTEAHPFDAVAAEYDARFTESRLGGWLRASVRSHVRDLVRPGDRALEIGCGTGEDALWLARKGVRVVATDASSAMLDVAARKAVTAGFGHRISFARLDLREIGRPEAEDDGGSRPGLTYDFVLANFGVLNCLPDRRPLAGRLAEWLRPGGHAGVVLMSPTCPWEVAWHLAHGRPGSAVRRLRPGTRAHLGHGTTIRVWYPSPRHLAREFGPRFALVRTVGIGALLPPSYLSGLVDRWPRLFARVAAWDRRLGPRWPWTRLADHYLAIYRRR